MKAPCFVLTSIGMRRRLSPLTALRPSRSPRTLLRLSRSPLILILIVVAVICSIVLNKTKAGRYMICLGANREAVRLSGVDTRHWAMLAYMIWWGMSGSSSSSQAA